MRKVALVFVLAVFVPSLVLAWLALRSLRDQQFVLERQQSLLYQGITDALAVQADTILSERQHGFSQQVEALLARLPAAEIATTFDEQLRTNWPLAQVGFVVTVDGDILCPSPYRGTDARTFLSCNSMFLANRESAEIYWNVSRANANYILADASGDKYNSSTFKDEAASSSASPGSQSAEPTRYKMGKAPATREATVSQVDALSNAFGGQNVSTLNNSPEFYRNQSKSLSYRNVNPQIISPQQQALNLDNNGVYEAKDGMDRASPEAKAPAPNDDNVRLAPPAAARARRDEPPTQRAQLPAPTPLQFSKSVPAEAEFRQIIGEANEGTLARFVDNKLNVLLWYRSPREVKYIFGAQLALTPLVAELKDLTQTLAQSVKDDVCVAVLDDAGKPVALSQPGFQTNWKRPFVATEIGEALPHWEIAAYLLNPDKFTRTAQTVRWALALLIALLVLAISLGSWLIVADLNRQLTLARQKTDFVSNVSHELKTPLTSIRMFSELLAEGRVADETKQRSYLNIITAEAARLTRLINNVLDFSRLERGEKKYTFEECDLVKVARETVESYRPHLENNGFKLDSALTTTALQVRGDCDALAQIIVNLLSNAEKYSNAKKEITLQAVRRDGPLPCAEVRVMDRGPGVPRGSEEKIFEKFYRAHDSLSSGIQGSGLGLTLARQIARAHGGDVVYEPREGGGSCFCVRLPLIGT